MDAADPRQMLSFQRFLLGRTRARLDEFRQAIGRSVRFGDAVLDLGTGSGILAFFACLAGASRVYAIETEPVIELAKLLARDNGFEDRIVFLNRASLEADLPGRVDVIVTDTFGLCGLQPGGLCSVIDARDRLLKADGTLIPRGFELFVAPVEVPDAYEHHVDFWSGTRNDVRFSAVRQLAMNNCYPLQVKREALLAEPASVAHVKLSAVNTVAFGGDVCAVVQKAGMLHGLCSWFTSELIDGVALGNEPGASTTNYAQGFFPLARPTPLAEGDRVRIRLSSFDGIHWRWRVDVEGGPDAGAPRLKARFDHSTFWGIPMSAGSLRRLARAEALASGRG